MPSPAYLFTGFLDSGKTTLIKETLDDENFMEGVERTLILCFEEGEVEYDDDWREKHNAFVEYFDNVEDLQKLRGSKYVQSRIGDTYKQAKGFLEDGREVLFTGTPCQIAGLYSYLGKMYDNLYTQDIICHGVPSPMVWEQYVEMRENKAASKTQRMFFRYKKYGWKTFAVLFEFKNNTAYVKNLREDSFMRAFLSNSCLRQSCYSCSFKGLQREADITLADFWGIQNFLPEMDDDKGTSLVLIHTDGGEKLFELIKDKVKFQAVDISLVSMYNSAVVKSCEPNKRRSSFLKDIATKDFEKTVFRYTSGSKLRRLLGKIKRKLFR